MIHNWTGCEIPAFLISLCIIAVSFFCLLVFIRLPLVIYRKEPWRKALKYRITDILPIIALAAALWIEQIAGPRVKAHVCGQSSVAGVAISAARSLALARNNASLLPMPPRSAGLAKPVNVHQSRATLHGTSV